jgi:hypothetical protein
VIDSVTLPAGKYFVLSRATMRVQSTTSAAGQAFCRIARPDGVGPDAAEVGTGGANNSAPNVTVPVRFFGHFDLAATTELRLECAVLSGSASVTAGGWNAIPVTSISVFS